jgi:hypothetical protein
MGVCPIPPIRLFSQYRIDVGESKEGREEDKNKDEEEDETFIVH